MLKILQGKEYGGWVAPKSYPGFSASQLRNAGVPETAISAAEVAADSDDVRVKLRSEIKKTAGDTLSLLGTASDAATIAVLAGAAIMSALEEEDYASFQTAALAKMGAISGEHDPIEIANAFLSSVAGGTIRLPALEKGIVAVLAEVEARGNAVAEALDPTPEDD